MSSPNSSSSFDAAETFAAALIGQVDNDSVKNMVVVQRDMLSRFEKTNEMLINFNILSSNRFSITSSQFRRHTQLLYDMKKDLDSIFKRIRVIKQKLRKSHPDAFKACEVSPLEEDEEEEGILSERQTTEEVEVNTDSEHNSSTDKASPELLTEAAVKTNGNKAFENS
ncbi:kxDL motif-containing protein 1-like [Dreissena polymorpha]|uniref:KxDL domain-containing protein n=1 Tax=Dreissena polymorpha TaxID=45954 RepID=A0A9D4KN86_DREPO|nr:kxDL motif-containing protein 1-like [Dreissena polymorpha]KAH3843008.1 hypothetical protein DPMN_116514 [Dreissena polymorpha]